MKDRMRGIGFLFVLLGTGAALASSGGPPASMTGAPGEGLCTGCHADFPVGTGGAVTLVDAPAYYRGGSTYTLTVRVESGQTSAAVDRAWGFQVTAVGAAGSGAGTLSTLDGQGTALVNGGGTFASRTYVEQDFAGIRSGAASPVSWNFLWTAPPAGTGEVTFHLAGLAANGDGSEGGDWVYSGSQVIGDSATAAVSTTWGGLKAIYR